MRRSSAYSLLAALALTLTACATPSPGPLIGSEPALRGAGSLESAAERTGDAAMVGGEYRVAADVYKTAFNKAPSPTLLVKWAKAMRLSGQSQEAILVLQRQVAERYPHDAQVLTEMARAGLAGGYLAEAKGAVDKAILLRDAPSETFLVAGVLAGRQGDSGMANGYFERARSLALTPQAQDIATANLALVKGQNGQLSEAIAELEAVAVRPGAHPRIHSNLGLLYALSGQPARARAAFMRAGLADEEAEKGLLWADVVAPAEAASKPQGRRRP